MATSLPSGTTASLDYLRKLERAAFPFRVSDPDSVQHIQELVSAALVEGGVGHSAVDQQRIAVVRRITPLGRAHLALVRSSDWAELAAQRRAGEAVDD